ncbi:Urease accessory protein [Phytophthora cinnamomi]|uniref:Urease accessory protein n=1 Tax=Phytophthora cinnamomi TaxID=4785 RepID=UPI00355948B6|nr:Urease accessory protein [Phytophthora cinnamomi]
MSPNAHLDTREAVRAALGSVTCQICLEEFMLKHHTTIKPVTHFCSPTCPAVFCSQCLEKHLQMAMQVTYAGALPKVRCPVCLVPVNRQQWTRWLSRDAVTTEPLLQQYKQRCEAACSFTCPGCHNPQYSQLPDFHQDARPDIANAVALTLRPREAARIPELRRVVRRFCRHRQATTARDVIRHITDNFPASKMDCIVHKVLPLIQDEERRATLLLAYHSVHRRVVTRCCGVFACFNCKRSLGDGNAPCPCEMEDQEQISDDDIVECRSCRVMLVKVDGCSSVWCVCGLGMSWTDELRIKKFNQRKLLPVDPFDMTMYDSWKSWHDALRSAAGEDCWELRQSAMLHSVNNSFPAFRETLRQFVWKRRFRKLITSAELELRHKFVIRLHPTFRESLRALVWRRRRFHCKLLDECRIVFVTRTARLQSPAIKPLMLKVMWYCRFRQQVLGSLLRRFYCLSMGWGDLSEEQQEIEEDQFAMFCIGLN